MVKETKTVITDDDLQSVSVEKAAKLLEQSVSQIRKLIVAKEIKALHINQPSKNTEERK